MTSESDAIRPDQDSRLETVGWGLFVLLSGAVLLLPGLPDGSWLTGVGAIILGGGIVRARLGLPVSVFWTTLGVGFVALGAGAIAGLAMPWFSLLLIVCGLALVISELGLGPRLA